MPRYHVNHRYSSHCDGRDFGPWEADTDVELEVEVAEWVNRSSPGVLSPIDADVAARGEADVATDGEAEPVKDRAHRGGRKRAADGA